MDDLASRLQRLPGLFPSTCPLVLKPGSPGAWASSSIGTRFTGGHAARWFSACDGQEGDEPFADAHALCSLEEAVAAMQIADDIRREPEGSWVEPHWLAIASDGAGQHLMIDDRDGRVLAVAHDDDHVDVVAPSVEAWLAGLLEGHARGTIVWNETFGLIDTARLAAIEEARRAHHARQTPTPLTVRQKLGLGVTMGAMATLIGLVIWWLESRRS
jgi:hypothetical protein